MPTSRTLGLALALLVGACAVDPGSDGLGQSEGELGARAAGIVDGSLEAEGVLLFANDRGVTADDLEQRATIPHDVAGAIVGFRTTESGAPRWFTTVDELDALPGTSAGVFQHLVAEARAEGYVEAPGFDPPTLRLSIPDDLGRPPTAADVTVEAGFDGKTPDEVLGLVRGRITNAVDSRNESFVVRTILDDHKAFTLAVNNLFAPGSPHAAFAQSLGADTLTMLGTMSAVRPTILVAERGGETCYYARGTTGRYEALDPPRYPIIMRARIRLGPEAGVRVFYPAWSAKVLAGPTTVITEGGSP